MLISSASTWTCLQQNCPHRKHSFSDDLHHRRIRKQKIFWHNAHNTAHSTLISLGYCFSKNILFRQRWLCLHYNLQWQIAKSSKTKIFKAITKISIRTSPFNGNTLLENGNKLIFHYGIVLITKLFEWQPTIWLAIH